MARPDRYTCEQVFQRLDAYMDRVLPPEELVSVEEHLATCAVCAREFAFERRLLDGLKEKLRRINVPPATLARVRAVLEAERRKSEAGTDRSGS
jgi:anti-sigma factor RsiW